jgi:hypothetical protein
VNEPLSPGAEPGLRRNGCILREASGVYLYRGLSDGRERGRERFHLTVHNDGSRLMRAMTDIAERDVQMNVMLRVEASFRPLDAALMLYTQGRFKGSTNLHVEGNRLLAVAHDTTGHTTREIEVPEKFSIGCHPICLDGWHTWPAAPISGEEQPTKIYFVNGSPIWSRPFLGTLQSHALVYNGEAELSVPAGRFLCRHFTLSGHSELWVHGPDLRLIRYDWTKLDRRYELSELTLG